MGFIDYWQGWLIIAFIILIVELMSGTYFLLALAGGAVITSLITALFVANLSLQLLYFALASALSYAVLASFKKEKTNITDGTHHMLGQHVAVVESIENQGRVRYKGVVWQATSDETLKKDMQAKIIAVNGSTLHVASITNAKQGEAT